MFRPRRLSGALSLPDCPAGALTGVWTSLGSDGSSPAEGSFSSAAQIGQKLASIGDELQRTYEWRSESRKVASNCQALLLRVMRSVKHFRSRVDRGAAVVPAREPHRIYPKVLLAVALVAICGVLVKLGFED